MLNVVMLLFVVTALGLDAHGDDTELIFDGETLDAWTRPDGNPVQEGWEVVDGAIHLKKGEKRSGNLVSKRLFGDFKLSFEFAIAEGGNSGLKYRVLRLGGRQLGCEYQIFDDAKRELSRKQQTASLYALFGPNESKMLNPAGEFNSAQIIVSGNTIEHWLNGHQVVAATVGDDDWRKRVASSKFSKVRGFGENRFGQIMLTDHGSEVWYRNFKLELLPVKDLGGEKHLTVGEEALLAAAEWDLQTIRLPSTNKPGESTETLAEPTRTRRRPLGVKNVVKPSMLVWRASPEVNTGAAVILCPSGGEDAGFEDILPMAKELSDQGVTAVLLKHRTSDEKNGRSKVAREDATAALQLVHQRAEEWGVDPEHIGIAGAGRGGALATLMAKQAPASNGASIKFLLLVDARRAAKAGALGEGLPTFVCATGSSKRVAPSVRTYLATLGAKNAAWELHNYRIKSAQPWAAEFVRFLRDQELAPAAERPQPLEYAGKSLEQTEPEEGRTLGDQRLAQLLGEEVVTAPLWPNGLGPDETLEDKPEVVSTRSRRGAALNIRGVTRPTLTVSPAKGQARPAVIVCPGGGYNGLAAEHEGVRVCQWFNEQGVAALLLKYRVPRRGGEFPKHHHALQDVARAMRLARENAEAWGIDPNRVGVCGFSAGGHLCTVLCATGAENAYEPVDETDKLSCRPNYGVLIYPAYLTEPLASDTPDPLLKSFPSDTPIFLAVARDDRFARGGLNFLLLAEAQGAKVDAHIYTSGGHGGGIDPASYPFSQWVEPCGEWLRKVTAKKK